MRAESRTAVVGDDCAVTPVVGVILLVAVTVVVALSVGFVLTTPDLEETPTASLSLTAESDDNRVALTHEGGDTLDVSALNLTVEVDGRPLAEQPPVPFFAADGFRAGPTGPFNSRSPDGWQAGERAGVRLAGTNAPVLTAGSTVTVIVAVEGAVIHRETVTAR
jgi:FlaG/FlaF family flagellin (archaellin)